MPASPVVRSSTDADSIHMIGQEVRVLLSASDTGGTHSLFELQCPPGDGPPPHIHSNEDETFIVLEGEVEFLIGAPEGLRVHRVGPGGCAFGPRGVAHTFRNPTDRPARVLVLATPGGFERFGRDVAKAFPKGSAVDVPVLVGIMRRHGMTVLENGGH
jgi:mannose-6-phosphate isomerase-like protein (cupin superfamily)